MALQHMGPICEFSDSSLMEIRSCTNWMWPPSFFLEGGVDECVYARLLDSYSGTPGLPNKHLLIVRELSWKRLLHYFCIPLALPSWVGQNRALEGRDEYELLVQGTPKHPAPPQVGQCLLWNNENPHVMPNKIPHVSFPPHGKCYLESSPVFK